MLDLDARVGPDSGIEAWRGGYDLESGSLVDFSIGSGSIRCLVPSIDVVFRGVLQLQELVWDVHHELVAELLEVLVAQVRTQA